MPVVIFVVLICVVLFKLFGRKGVFAFHGMFFGFLLSGLAYSIICFCDYHFFTLAGWTLALGGGSLFGGAWGVSKA
jgi:hypothetical protein